MPLLDHFHPPLSNRRDWHSFHHAWATFIAGALNRTLPPDYFAQPFAQYNIEIDVATFEEPVVLPIPELVLAGPQPRPAVAAPVWAPPAPAETLAFPLVQEHVEVQVFRDFGGRSLVGAIELVSPANKDRPAHRDAFVAKCITYLQQGVGLVIVDIVTERRANLHLDLVDRLAATRPVAWEPDLYTTTYRLVQRDGVPQLDLWRESLALGEALPTMPLWLAGALCVPVELEATYQRTCFDLRIADMGQLKS